MSTNHPTGRLTTAATYVVRKTDTIGNPAAESDSAYLIKCFVNNESDLDHLRNCRDQRGIVVGRTGAGKTALLQMLSHYEQRVIALNPHDLALGYISNSPVLRFFESLGIKMDVFYRALWRHVLVVEILKKYFDLTTDQDRANPWDVLRYRVFRKRAHLDALAYLRKRGSEFWNTTEELIKEITVTAESELRASVDVSLQHFIALGGAGTHRLSTEQRDVLHQLGQEVVNRIQMSKLAALFNALDEEMLTDDQKRYYIVVDQLDENWVDDSVRYQLVRALIETMREFNSKVENAKVVIALRVDLLDRVLSHTTDSGFQGEKYKALCLRIKWTGKNLLGVLDRRVNQLIANRYSGSHHVDIHDILPTTVGGRREPIADYILSRTLMRPRDVIAFFNMCIERGEGNLPITPHQLQDVEPAYSRDRFNSLMDEWSVPYPYLRTLSQLLAGKSASIRLGDISHSELERLSLQIACVTNPAAGEDYNLLWRHAESKIDDRKLLQGIALIFYRVGLVGLKLETFSSAMWSGDSLEPIRENDITADARMCIHRMFCGSLGVNPC
jgi:hypothetical protein